MDSIRSMGGSTAGHDVIVSHFNPMPKSGLVIQHNQSQSLYRKRSRDSKSSKSSRANSSNQYALNYEAAQELKKANLHKKNPCSGRGRGRPRSKMDEQVEDSNLV